VLKKKRKKERKKGEREWGKRLKTHRVGKKDREEETTKEGGRRKSKEMWRGGEEAGEHVSE
jgi:hypothetical protein